MAGVEKWVVETVVTNQLHHGAVFRSSAYDTLEEAISVAKQFKQLGYGEGVLIKRVILTEDGYLMEP